MQNHLFKIALLVTAGSLGAFSPAWAQDQGGDEQSLRVQLDAAQTRINALERRLEALENASGLGLTGQALSDVRGRGRAPLNFTTRTYSDGVVAIVQEESSGGGGEAAMASVQEEGEEDRKAPAPTEAVEAVTRSEQGYFGDRLSFEAGMVYSHFDDARINLSGFLALDAIFLGLISIDEITADIIGLDFTARYGLTDRLQVDVNVPYLFRYSNFSSGGAGNDASGLIEEDVRDNGLGDINVGASYRLLKESVNRPDVVVNVRAKFPTGQHPFGVELVEVPGSGGNLSVPASLATGSGVYGASAGVSILKTLDPMVVFGSVTYFYNFARSFDDLDEAIGDQPGRAKIGNAIQYGAGVAYALNERSSLSMSFSQRLVARTRLARGDQPYFRVVGSQANVGILNLGANFALTDQLSLLTTVGLGMTSDAPDMILSVRVPFRF